MAVRIKVLHIVDVYLPETMNWLLELWLQTSDLYEHHIYAKYQITDMHPKLYQANPSVEIVHYPIKLLTKIQLRWKELGLEQYFKNYCTKYQISKVHFHFGNIAVEYANRFKDIKVNKLVSIYGYDYEKLIHQNPKYAMHYRRLALDGYRFIVEGYYSRRVIHSYGVSLDQIYIVHMLYKRNYHVSKIDFNYVINCCQVASYTEKKGQDILLEAAGLLNSNRLVINFYGEIVDPIYYNKLILIKSKYPNLRVNFNGKLATTDYLEVLAKHHIAINCSKRSRAFDTEGGCPVFIKDALYLSKPILSTDHCDIPELLVHGYNGWMARENDVNSTVEQLKNILKLTPKDYLNLSNQAFLSVATNVTSEITRKDLITAYQLSEI